MAKETVPGDTPSAPSATVTPIATKQREHATAILMASILELAHEQLRLLELGVVNTNDNDAEAVMIAAQQMTRTIGHLADRAGRAIGSNSSMRDPDEWAFTDVAAMALATLEGRAEAAA